MSKDPIAVVRAILVDPTNMDIVAPLVSDDFTYVSLNYDNPDLKKLMPWCGTGHGARGIVDTFIKVGQYWETIEFDMKDVFGSGENVAIFGRFTYRSTMLGKLVTTPFAVFAKVTDGRCTTMQFMEDTFATAESFRSRGVYTFQSNPDGSEVTVGSDTPAVPRTAPRSSASH